MIAIYLQSPFVFVRDSTLSFNFLCSASIDSKLETLETIEFASQPSCSMPLIVFTKAGRLAISIRFLFISVLKSEYSLRTFMVTASCSKAMSSRVFASDATDSSVCISSSNCSFFGYLFLNMSRYLVPRYRL